MRLQMGRVDHQPARLAGLARQFGEYLVEHPKTAPTHEPVVDRLVWTIVTRGIAPAQSVPDDKNDPADHPAVIHSRDPVGKRKIGRDPLHLRTRQPEQAIHGSPPNQATIESSKPSTSKKFNGS